jgi:BirA family transcriptional regulator, biotin operon repressor / biotin---[acetyl-CoA-carboxylase] ligase
MEGLTAASIRAGLGTAFVGQEVHVWPEIGSTNDEARRLARAGAPEGTLVIAEHQTAGRGRLERRWEAPPGSSLLLSLILRPALAPAQVQRLTMVCGMAVVEAVEATSGLVVGLKWPNDVVAGAAKLGGILAEMELQGEAVAHAVLGVGLNVNVRASDLPQDTLPASSLSEILGEPVPRLPLLQALLRAVERRVLALAAGHSPHEEWAGRLVTLSRQVTVSGAGPAFQGTAVGVNPNGALLVRRADGRLETVLAGDVTLRKAKAFGS